MGPKPGTSALGGGGRGTGGRANGAPSQGTWGARSWKDPSGEPPGKRPGPPWSWTWGPRPERAQRCGLQSPAVETGPGGPGQSPARHTSGVPPRSWPDARGISEGQEGAAQSWGPGSGRTAVKPLSFCVFLAPLTPEGAKCRLGIHKTDESVNLGSRRRHGLPAGGLECAESAAGGPRETQARPSPRGPGLDSGTTWGGWGPGGRQ